MKSLTLCVCLQSLIRSLAELRRLIWCMAIHPPGDCARRALGQVEAYRRWVEWWGALYLVFASGTPIVNCCVVIYRRMIAEEGVGRQISIVRRLTVDTSFCQYQLSIHPGLKQGPYIYRSLLPSPTRNSKRFLSPLVE